MSKVKTLLFLGLVTAFLYVAAPARAQSVLGQGDAAGQSYGASNQSDFQNAAFQQSGSSAATTAAGSGELLKQESGQTIIVTGAPAYQPKPAEQSNRAPVLLWVLLACSGLGIILLYIYQRRSRQTHSEAETKEVAEVFDQPKPKAEKPKKPKKKSSKKKKTHR